MDPSPIFDEHSFVEKHEPTCCGTWDFVCQFLELGDKEPVQVMSVRVETARQLQAWVEVMFLHTAQDEVTVISNCAVTGCVNTWTHY